MGTAFSYQKGQIQGDFNNHSPLLVKGRNFCHCDGNCCEEQETPIPEKDQTTTEDSGSDVNIMIYPDLASCAAEMELDREENGSQWPEEQCLQDYKGVDHGQPIAP